MGIDLVLFMRMQIQEKTSCRNGMRPFFRDWPWNSGAKSSLRV